MFIKDHDESTTVVFLISSATSGVEYDDDDDRGRDSAGEVNVNKGP